MDSDDTVLRNGCGQMHNRWVRSRWCGGILEPGYDKIFEMPERNVVGSRVHFCAVDLPSVSASPNIASVGLLPPVPRVTLNALCTDMSCAVYRELMLQDGFIKLCIKNMAFL